MCARKIGASGGPIQRLDSRGRTSRSVVASRSAAFPRRRLASGSVDDPARDRDWLETLIEDTDTFLEDNGTPARPSIGGQAITGVTYADGTRVEAEYRLTLTIRRRAMPGQVLGFNVNNSNPAYCHGGGAAFVGPVGGFPPVGVPLTVTGRLRGAGVLRPARDRRRRPGSPPCFVAGTRILTPAGWRAVETLGSGRSWVITRDRGPQRFAGVGAVTLDAACLAREADLRPLRIRPRFCVRGPGQAAAASEGLGRRSTGILLSGATAGNALRRGRELCAARHLVDEAGIAVDTACASVTYHHILFATHEIRSGRWPVGRKLPARPEGLRGIPQSAQDEVLRLFPRPGRRRAARGFDAARPFLRRYEAGARGLTGRTSSPICPHSAPLTPSGRRA